MLVGETNQTCGSSLQFFQRIFCFANIQSFYKISNVFESYCRFRNFLHNLNACYSPKFP